MENVGGLDPALGLVAGAVADDEPLARHLVAVVRWPEAFPAVHLDHRVVGQLLHHIADNTVNDYLVGRTVPEWNVRAVASKLALVVDIRALRVLRTRLLLGRGECGAGERDQSH